MHDAQNFNERNYKELFNIQNLYGLMRICEVNVAVLWLKGYGYGDSFR